MTTNLIKLTILVIICGLSKNIFAEPQKKNREIVTGSEIQNVAHGYSITIHKCWSIAENDDQHPELDDRDIYPTDKCAPAERGTWGISTHFNAPATGTINDYWRVERLTPRQISYETKVNVSGQTVVLAEKVEPENNKFINHQDQKNVGWLTIVECKGKYVMIGYDDYLDKPAREKARKDHSIPPVFKEFLAGFKCDKK